MLHIGFKYKTFAISPYTNQNDRHQSCGLVCRQNVWAENCYRCGATDHGFMTSLKAGSCAVAFNGALCASLVIARFLTAMAAKSFFRLRAQSGTTSSTEEEMTSNKHKYVIFACRLFRRFATEIGSAFGWQDVRQ